MGSSSLTPGKNRRRAWLVAAAPACVVILAVIAVATRGFSLANSTDRTSNERTAQDRCEPEVLNRLAEKSTAKLSDVEVARTALDPDSKDMFSLLDHPSQRGRPLPHHGMERLWCRGCPERVRGHDA